VKKNGEERANRCNCIHNVREIGGTSLINEMMLSGFLFLFILVLALVIAALGYLWEKDDYDPDADLQKIHKNLKKFKKGFLLALVHNGCVIALPILLFIAFSHYNLILGIVWTISRIGEGLILFY
jgi:hypothetical protein